MRTSCDPQIIYALERAKNRLEDEAKQLHEAHDYSAEFPANDAEQIGRAIVLLSPDADDVSTPRPGECPDALVLARDRETGEPRMAMVRIAASPDMGSIDS